MTQSRTLAQVVNRVDATETATTTNATDITSNDVQLARGGNHGRNLIINGDFSVWQRSTSTAFGPAASAYVADRWQCAASTGVTRTISRQTHTLGQTDVPGSKYFFRAVNSTPGSAADYILRTKVEDVTRTAGRLVTLSFKAKADSARTLEYSHRQQFGSGGSPSSAVVATSGTHSLTTSWQTFTTTFTPASITGKSLGTNNDDHLEIRFRDDTEFADGYTIDIDDVQLEFGGYATDFEYVTPADQLARCQRYFQKSYNSTTDPATVTITGRRSHDANGQPNQLLTMPLMTTMRGTPTVVLYAPSDGSTAKLDVSGTPTTAVVIDEGESSFVYYPSSTPTIGNNLDVHYTADAEL